MAEATTFTLDSSICNHGNHGMTTPVVSSINPPGSQAGSQLFQAIADYSPRHDGELMVRTGDIITSVRPLGNGWSLGRNESSSRAGGSPVAGIFPSRCIVIVTSSEDTTSTPSSNRPSTATQPTPPPREFNHDGIARQAACSNVVTPPHCPECMRCTGNGSATGCGNRPPAVFNVGAPCTSFPVHRASDNNSPVVDCRSLPSPAAAAPRVTGCGLGCREHHAEGSRLNSFAVSAADHCDVELVDVHRFPGSSKDTGNECTSYDGGCVIDGTVAGRRRADQHSLDVQMPNRGCHASCRHSHTAGRSDRSVENEDRQPEVNGTPDANAQCGAATSSPPPVTPRRQAPQPPKPHLIVKPTRDPTGITDSPALSTRDNRPLQQQQQQQQSHSQRPHPHHQHRRRGVRDDDCPNYINSDAVDNDRCQHRSTGDNDDAEDVQPAWCGWRTISRDRRRSATASSSTRLPCPQASTSVAMANTDPECRLSTFIGRSDPNMSASLAQIPSSPNRRPYIGDSDDNNPELSLRQSRTSKRRCKHQHRRPRSNDRHDDIDPSAVVFRTINGSVPDMSFGLSPSVGAMHFRLPVSCGGGKTVLNSRTPNVSDHTVERSGSAGRRRQSKLATCWCRLVGSTVVGLVSGALTFGVMTFDLGYNLLPAFITAAVIVLLIAAALVGSNLCRCITGLVLPSLSTACGRVALCLLAAHLLLGGPVENVAYNAGEAVRALTCSAELALNRTAGLMRPFDAMMRELDRTVARLEGAASDVSRGLRPLDEGLDAVEMDVFNARTQLLGTRRTCKNLIDRAFVACDSGILKAQTQCLGVMGALGTVYHHARDVLDRINPERWARQQQGLSRKRRADSPAILSPGGGTEYSIPPSSSIRSMRDDEQPVLERLPADSSNICEPLSTTQVCRGLNDSDTLCQPARWAGEAIQEAINGTRVAMRALEDALRFRVTSTPYEAARSNANSSVSVHQGYTHFQRHAGYVIDVVVILRNILPGLIVLLVIYDAFRYSRSYLCAGDSFDNIYIGQTFVRLDRRRYDATGNRLLPLRKHERRHLVDATMARMSPPECRLLMSGMCVVALCLACSIACCTFDHALYWVLSSAEDSLGLGARRGASSTMVDPIQLLRQRSESQSSPVSGEIIDVDGMMDASGSLNSNSASPFQQKQQQNRRRNRDSEYNYFRSNAARRSRQTVNANGPAATHRSPPFDDPQRHRAVIDSTRRSAATEDVVTGDGVVVDLLDVFVRGFRSDETKSTAATSSMSIENARTAVCIPVARPPSVVVLLALGVAHLLFAVTVAFKAYAFRARPAVTGYFFPDRSAERAVHLYSVLVRRRRRLPSLLRRLAFVGRRRLLQAVASGTVGGGRCAAFLRRCDARDVRCVVCWDSDCGSASSCSRWRSSASAMTAVSPTGTANSAGKFRHCACGAVYCPECFVDVGRSCPLCRHDNAAGTGNGGGSNDYRSNDDGDDETDDYDDFDECMSFDDDLNDASYYDTSVGRLHAHRGVEL